MSKEINHKRKMKRNKKRKMGMIKITTGKEGMEIN